MLGMSSSDKLIMNDISLEEKLNYFHLKHQISQEKEINENDQLNMEN